MKLNYIISFCEPYNLNKNIPIFYSNFKKTVCHALYILFYLCIFLLYQFYYIFILYLIININYF